MGVAVALVYDRYYDVTILACGGRSILGSRNFNHITMTLIELVHYVVRVLAIKTVDD